jgi:hypothetical protein
MKRKRLIVVLVAISLLFGAAGCSKTGSTQKSGQTSNDPSIVQAGDNPNNKYANGLKPGLLAIHLVSGYDFQPALFNFPNDDEDALYPYGISMPAKKDFANFFSTVGSS